MAIARGLTFKKRRQAPAAALAAGDPLDLARSITEGAIDGLRSLANEGSTPADDASAINSLADSIERSLNNTDFKMAACSSILRRHRESGTAAR